MFWGHDDDDGDDGDDDDGDGGDYDYVDENDDSLSHQLRAYLMSEVSELKYFDISSRSGTLIQLTHDHE